MAVYVVTGKLGSGKSLVAVGRIKEYLEQGRPVATNLDINLSVMFSPRSRHMLVRVPDKPRLDDMMLLGCSQETYDEKSTGLVVLDECATWLNSRDWNDKERHALLEWFLHSRKRGWDVYLLVQDIDALDKQLRSALAEHVVVCRRLDRFAVPFFGGIAKLLGLRLRPPQIHVAAVWYGLPGSGMKVDRWWFRGRDLYGAYDTRQVFTSDQHLINGELVDMRATRTLLSPWHTHGRHLPQPVPWLRAIGQFLGRALAWVAVHGAAACTGRRPVQVAASWGILAPAVRARYGL